MGRPFSLQYNTNSFPAEVNTPQHTKNYTAGSVASGCNFPRLHLGFESFSGVA